MIQKKDCQLASLVVLVSLLLCGGILTLEMGLSRTPYETTDSLGRRMGFNDPFSLEHYGIMLTHFHPKTMFRSEAIYTWVLLLAHVFGFVVLGGMTKPERGWTRWLRRTSE